LLLDSYFRTIQGFCIVVEKEWISFGHKFAQRTGHSSGQHSDEQRAPIFLQFIDCVWQLLQQFPNSFQFNEEMLIVVIDALYSCQFGTFLFNNDKERNTIQIENQPNSTISQKTTSLWTFILARQSEFINPHFKQSNEVLFPIVSMKNLQLWNRFYLRFNSDVRIIHAASNNNNKK